MFSESYNKTGLKLSYFHSKFWVGLTSSDIHIFNIIYVNIAFIFSLTGSFLVSLLWFNLAGTTAIHSLLPVGWGRESRGKKKIKLMDCDKDTLIGQKRKEK